jgi:hypothetical protein
VTDWLIACVGLDLPSAADDIQLIMKFNVLES